MLSMFLLQLRTFLNPPVRSTLEMDPDGVHSRCISVSCTLQSFRFASLYFHVYTEHLAFATQTAPDTCSGACDRLTLGRRRRVSTCVLYVAAHIWILSRLALVTAAPHSFWHDCAPCLERPPQGRLEFRPFVVLLRSCTIMGFTRSGSYFQEVKSPSSQAIRQDFWPEGSHFVGR